MLKDLWNQAGESFLTQLYDFHLTLSLLCSQCFSHYNSTCGSDSQLFHVSAALPPLFTSHHSCMFFFYLAFDSKVNFSMFNIQITTVRKRQKSDKNRRLRRCGVLSTAWKVWTGSTSAVSEKHTQHKRSQQTNLTHSRGSSSVLSEFTGFTLKTTLKAHSEQSQGSVKNQPVPQSGSGV